MHLLTEYVINLHAHKYNFKCIVPVFGLYIYNCANFTSFFVCPLFNRPTIMRQLVICWVAPFTLTTYMEYMIYILLTTRKMHIWKFEKYPWHKKVWVVWCVNYFVTFRYLHLLPVCVHSLLQQFDSHHPFDVLMYKYVFTCLDIDKTIRTIHDCFTSKIT